MRRLAVAGRPDWVSLADGLGFTFHTSPAAPYWVDDACYALTRRQVERDITAATADAVAMCARLLDRAAGDDEILASLGIERQWWDGIRDSWLRAEGTLYGRFDLAYDGRGAARILEFNADVPGTLFESAHFQWHWFEALHADGAVPRAADQFNRLHEALVGAFRALAGQHAILHVAASLDDAEERCLARYLCDCACQSGRAVDLIDIGDIGIGAAGQWLDLDGRPITWLFKVYRWDLLLREPFARFLGGERAPQLVEPRWKMVLASKGILAWLWRMFPRHPNLLPTWFEDDPAANPGQSYVTKPLFSNRGANVRIVSPELPGGELSTGGPYGPERRVVQAYHRLPVFRSAAGERVHAVLGSWVVAGRPEGLAVYEDTGPIVGHATMRFVPHIVLP